MTDGPAKSRVSRGNFKRNKNTRDKRSNNVNGGGYKSALDHLDAEGNVRAEGQQPIDESRQCIICAESIEYAAYSPCQHKTCHKCCLRQRALYKRDLCLVCRTPNDHVIISDQIDSDIYNDDANHELPSFFNDKFKIYFTTEEIESNCLELLELKCHFKHCGTKFTDFKDLQDHIKLEHNRYFCLICYNNKKAFISELALYHYKSLQTHQTIGDEKGFKGHPACKHCVKKRFYSEDELNVHIRDSHERCHICDQDIPDVADYYKNYEELYNHFRLDHYVCTVQSCLDKKFVVFREDLDLTAHMLKEHGSLASSNNKVVLGAGRAYQSQLSTYQRTENGGRAGDNNEQTDPINVKRMRLEERAKHYLEYDNEKIDQFFELNSSFRANNVTADELGDAYKKLFKKRTIEEILIVLTELSELYPESGAKFKSLQETIKKIERASNVTEFPILGGKPQSPTVNLHAWGNGSGSPLPGSNSRASSSVESFPALQKPQPKKSQSPQLNQQPIRYSTITKTQPKKPAIVSIHSFNNDSSFRPSYLEPSSSSSGSLTRVTSPAGSSSSDPSKFPKLEKKTAKKTFPRVNPVSVPPALQWGQVSQPQLKVEEDFGIPIIDKRKQKKKASQ